MYSELHHGSVGTLLVSMNTFSRSCGTHQIFIPLARISSTSQRFQRDASGHDEFLGFVSDFFGATVARTFGAELAILLDAKKDGYLYLEESSWESC